jgi:hypothetical protein
MTRLLLITVYCLLLLTIFIGCASTPAGYDADTTPDHNGEQWIGGNAK